MRRIRALLACWLFSRLALALVQPKYPLRLLLVDHYDSFTYNLADLFARVCVDPPHVVAYDALPDNIHDYDALILSPGPGSPPQSSIDLVRRHPNLPILGVCLGHQILGEAYGGRVVPAPVPIHGEVHEITLQTNDCPLFRGLPDRIPVTRYHSLQVVDLPSSVKATGLSEDGVLMGCQAPPHFGVQFHPESIGTVPYGEQMIANFCDLVASSARGATGLPMTMREPVAHMTIEKPTPRVFIRRVESAMKSEDVLNLIDAPYRVWLENGILGGSQHRRIEYFSPHEHSDMSGVYEYNDRDEVNVHDTDILSFLEDRLPSRLETVNWVNEDGSIATRLDSELPFDFRGGYVGYLGYEVRHDTQKYLEELEGGTYEAKATHGNPLPTAAFLYLTRSFVFHEGSWYLVGVAENDPTDEGIMTWVEEMAHTMEAWIPPVRPETPVYTNGFARPPVAFRPNRSRETYNRNFEDCLEYIRRGDSYELCLTNQLEATVPRRLDPLELYRTLQRRNPAPHSAFMQWKAPSSEFAICCSSPERFVSVRRTEGSWQAEAKPIKGTAARVLAAPGKELTAVQLATDEDRARELEKSVKNRAENLMIVDLLRNDMNRVCTTGSVHVAKLMAIESFATVHQMVSTIRGSLEVDAGPIDVLRACFPGGSMTGAPKLRTVELLDELEESVSRGPYSGSLGYISLNGSMDMNIVIRTAVLSSSQNDRWKVSVGAGGAITALSESDDEYQEMLLKSRAVRKAVEEWAVISHAFDASANEPTKSPDVEPVLSLNATRSSLR